MRSQWKFYQTECVPEEFYVEHVGESNKGKMQDSHWRRRVEEEFGLGISASNKEERQMKRIDVWVDRVAVRRQKHGKY